MSGFPWELTSLLKKVYYWVVEYLVKFSMGCASETSLESQTVTTTDYYSLSASESSMVHCWTDRMMEYPSDLRWDGSKGYKTEPTSETSLEPQTVTTTDYYSLSASESTMVHCWADRMMEYPSDLR